MILPVVACDLVVPSFTSWGPGYWKTLIELCQGLGREDRWNGLQSSTSGFEKEIWLVVLSSGLI